VKSFWSGVLRAVIFSRICMPEVGLRYRKRMRLPLFVLAMGLSCVPSQLIAQQSATSAVSKTKVIVDTDIGDDIDDAFALALAMRSPELEILGITTGWVIPNCARALCNAF
jgi:hypothetical protein